MPGLTLAQNRIPPDCPVDESFPWEEQKTEVNKYPNTGENSPLGGEAWDDKSLTRYPRSRSRTFRFDAIDKLFQSLEIIRNVYIGGKSKRSTTQIIPGQNRTRELGNSGEGTKPRLPSKEKSKCHPPT